MTKTSTTATSVRSLPYPHWQRVFDGIATDNARDSRTMPTGQTRKHSQWDKRGEAHENDRQPSRRSGRAGLRTASAHDRRGARLEGLRRHRHSAGRRRDGRGSAARRARDSPARRSCGELHRAAARHPEQRQHLHAVVHGQRLLHRLHRRHRGTGVYEGHLRSSMSQSGAAYVDPNDGNARLVVNLGNAFITIRTWTNFRSTMVRATGFSAVASSSSAPRGAPATGTRASTLRSAKSTGTATSTSTPTPPSPPRAGRAASRWRSTVTLPLQGASGCAISDPSRRRAAALRTTIGGDTRSPARHETASRRSSTNPAPA